MKLLWLCCLVLVLGVVVEGQNPPKVGFENLHDKEVTVYWDQFEKATEKNGLMRLEDIKPGKTGYITTTPGHKFEIYETRTRVFLALVEAQQHSEHFIIYGEVRQCGKDDNLLPPFLISPTTPLSVFTDFHFFLKTALPLYREKRVIEPTPNIIQTWDREEKRRQYLNAEQPKVTPTFTDLGYQVVPMNPNVFSQVKKFWDENRHKANVEPLTMTNHHMNHWESPTYLLPLPMQLRNSIINTVRPVLEKWIGGTYELEYTSLYGIRMYVNNSYLLNHVDRSATHAVSAIIQVDQRVDEDWLLEVIGHDKKANYVKLLPGQMALYESASVIHGREERLNGDYFANLFVHFRPRHNWNVKSF